MADELRVLALFNRSVSDSEIEATCEQLSRVASDTLGQRLVVHNSAAWYREQFQKSGSWEAWIWETVSGIDYRTRAPHFSGFVVCSETLGRANAGIVRQALAAKKAVLHLHPSGLRSVTQLNVLPTDSWVNGWSVSSVKIGE